MTPLQEKIETLATIRDLFGHCFYCAASIAHTPFAELVKVDGRNRLAHAECPEGATDAA